MTQGDPAARGANEPIDTNQPSLRAPDSNQNPSGPQPRGPHIQVPPNESGAGITLPKVISSLEAEPQEKETPPDSKVSDDVLSFPVYLQNGSVHHAMTFGDDQKDEPIIETYDPAIKWWSLSLENVFNLVRLIDPTSGLDVEEVPEHARDLGDNRIRIQGGPKWYFILARQFLNAITLILGIVIVISIIFKDWAEFGVVLAIVIFNGGLGFYQEFSAEKSMQSLKEMTVGVARVIRNGAPEVIFIHEVVVGDVIILEQGACVPADCRVFESNGLEVDEALLTGEALPVLKHAKVIPDPESRCALGDRKNMVFRNTLVTQGRGKAVVIAAGPHTEMGKLAKQLSSSKGNEKTDLMVKLDYMMYILFACAIVLGVVVFAVHKMEFNALILSYATAVGIAIFPESLSAVITVAMTASMKQMAQKKCIVRKLPVLEVIGGVTDICSDKTGTLTENKMVVKKVLIGSNETYLVTGAPYDVHGMFVPINEYGVEEEALEIRHKYPDCPHIYEFFRCCALCSSTILRISDDDMDTLVGNGNPTEIAVQAMTWKAQLNRDQLEGEGWVCLAEYAFDSTIKRMSAAWYKASSKELYLCTKGAPERILDLCTYIFDEKGAKTLITHTDIEKINHVIGSMARQGLRTLCFACRDEGIDRFPVPKDKPFADLHVRSDIEHDLVFLGVVGMYDPPRPESLPSIIACQHAGIRVRMLTGDHILSAGTIASMLNIIPNGDVDDPIKLQAGPDFDKLDDATIDAWEDLPYVIGRCSPESKVKMIESLHRRKRVVAMTGDGFNDSPSIKIANVGCAMGSGVDVTKGVADLIIMDDNFATIVKAIAEGRRIAQCICKFIVHLLSSNVAEVIVLICGLGFSHEGNTLFILSPLEILWLNMLTSAPPAIGLSMDSPTEDILLVPPNTRGVFSLELIMDTCIYGLWLGAASLIGFVVILYGFENGPAGHDCNKRTGTMECKPVWQARCTAFSILYFGLFIHAYTVRHPRLSIFRMKWLDNMWIFGSVVMGTVLFIPIVYVDAIAHNIFVHHMITWHWAVLVVAVLSFLGLCELYKVIKNILYPIKRLSVFFDEEERSEILQEYRTFTHTDHDARSLTEINEENLRMSFASFAHGVGTTSTASFRFPPERRKSIKKKKKRLAGYNSSYGVNVR
ncbi:unnamed protein product [Phytomonas sp. EM1]|nr:unnamed protein product [Phytomonas sp. EM1]|eukprot:CCW62060.1 unnamed protein product [Phytomonas sp. isolate EM1]